MKNFNKKLGVTLIEALLGLSIISTVSIYGGIEYKEYLEKEKVYKMALKLESVLSAFDQRFYIDGYDASNWGSGLSFNTNDLVSSLINKELISTFNKSCGVAGGWNPLSEDKRESALVSCEMISFNNLDLNESIEIYIDDNNFMESISYYVGVSELPTDKNFDDKFSSLINILPILKQKSESNISGLKDYFYVNEDNITKKIGFKECMSAKNKCLIASVWSRSGETEQLNINETNSMLNDAITFRITPSEKRLLCDVWEYESTTSTYTLINEGEFCGVGIYDKLNPTPYVKMNTEYTTLNQGVFLNEYCVNYNTDSNGFLIEDGTNPCGSYLENGTNKVITFSNTIKSVDMRIENLISKTATFDNLTVVNKLKSLGSTELELLEVTDVSLFKDSVNLKENAVVNNNLQVENLKLQTLLVKESAIFKKDVINEKDLEITGQVSAPHIVSTINVNPGDSCVSDQEGSMAIHENNGVLLVCKRSPRLNSLTWQSNSVGEISPFNSECPSGWRELTEAEGRFIVGTGSITNSLGILESYTLNQSGGGSTVILSEENIPNHRHSMKNLDHELLIPSSEKEGVGKVAFDANKNYLKNDLNSNNKVLETDKEGSGKPTENRPSYYAVNWCISEDPSSTKSNTNTPVINFPWHDYETEITPWISDGMRYDCTTDNEKIVFNPTTGISERVRFKTCKQKQIRTIQEREIQYNNTNTSFIIRDKGAAKVENRVIEIEEAWIKHTPTFTPWIDYDLPFNCSNPGTVVPKGSGFEYRRMCNQMMERYRQEREIEIGTDEIRNDGPPIREIKNERKYVYQEINHTRLTCTAWTFSKYLSNDWIPNLDSYYARDNIRQTRTARDNRTCSYYGTISTGETINYKNEVENRDTIAERFRQGNIVVGYITNKTVTDPPYKVTGSMNMRIQLDAPVPSNGRTYKFNYATQSRTAKEYDETQSGIGASGVVRAQVYFPSGDVDTWIRPPGSCGWVGYPRKGSNIDCGGGRYVILDRDATRGGGENVTFPNGAPKGHYLLCYHAYNTGTLLVSKATVWYGDDKYIRNNFNVYRSTSGGCHSGNPFKSFYFDPDTKYDVNDFYKTTGSVTFTAGQTYKDINIRLLGGLPTEGQEYFNFYISPTTPLTVASRNVATIVINK